MIAQYSFSKYEKKLDDLLDANFEEKYEISKSTVQEIKMIGLDMWKIIKIVCLFIILALIVYFLFFNDEKKNTVPNEFYNIEILSKEVSSAPFVNFDFNSSVRENIFAVECNFENLKLVYKATTFSEDKIFQNSSYEFIFKRIRNIHNEPPSIGTCLIGINNKWQAFYIYWVNSNKCDTIIKYDDEFDVLGKFTDTVYSNINKNIIKKLYPDYKRVIITKNITKIIFPNERNTKLNFYEEIIFDNFDLGIPFWYISQKFNVESNRIK